MRNFAQPHSCNSCTIFEMVNAKLSSSPLQSNLDRRWPQKNLYAITQIHY